MSRLRNLIKFKSIKSRLMSMIALLVALACLSLTAVSYLLARDAMIKQIDESMSSQTMQTRRVIEERVTGYWTGLEAFTSTDHFRDLKGNQSRIKQLINMFSTNSGHLYAFVATADGQGYTSTGVKIDISDREYFQKAMMGRNTVSEPLISKANGQLNVFFVVPVLNNTGDIIGVMGAARPASELSVIVSDISVGETGYAYLLGATGNVIGHLQQDLVTGSHNNIETGPNEFGSAELIEIEKKMIAQEIGKGEYKLNGTTYSISYRPVSTTGWNVAIVAPKNELFGSVTTLGVISMILALVFVVISLILSFIIAKSVSTPIEVVSGDINELGIGNTERDVAEHFMKREDEIGNLARATQSITDSLREKTKAMKQIAAGNLDVTINERSDKDDLSKSVLRVVNRLNTLVQETNQLTASAAQGDLEKRGNATRFEGAYREIIQGVNDTLDAMTVPLTEAGEVLGRISYSDVTVGMTGEYKGAFKDLAHQINMVRKVFTYVQNSCIAVAEGDFSSLSDLYVKLEAAHENNKLLPSIVGMMESVQSLGKAASAVADAAKSGNLSYQADASEYKGAYAEVVSNLNEALKAMSAPLQEMKIGLSAMADGDLTETMEGEYEGEYQVISDAINKSLASMNGILRDIASTADQVAAGSMQISNGSMQLSQGATEQASSVEELSASITEVTSATKSNAAHARTASEISENAKQAAEGGNEQMEQMQAAMKAIDTASSNIGKIIKVIDDIAFQTNILALNAAVEAARAGQHGRGFAVVAEEVRNLAMRSSQAANETTSYIESTLDKVKAGNKIADGTAKSLKDIVESIDETAKLVSDIASASNEQASGLSQIMNGIEQVSRVVQNNSATSEESAAASEALKNQAQTLNEAISQFRLSMGQTKGSTRADKMAVQAAADIVDVADLEDDGDWNEDSENTLIADDEGYESIDTVEAEAASDDISDEADLTVEYDSEEDVDLLAKYKTQEKPADEAATDPSRDPAKAEDFGLEE